MIITGYQQDNQGSWIAKDPAARLIYSMEWADWLLDTDSIISVTHDLQVRANDPTPLIKNSDGVQDGHLTYIELSGGAAGKIYTITTNITTNDGLLDSRSFRVKVEHRSA